MCSTEKICCRFVTILLDVCIPLMEKIVLRILILKFD